MRRRGPQFAKLDMYRKVPMDLVEGSKRGSVISWVAILVILWLFYKETAEFFTTTLSSQLSLDKRQSEDDQIKVTFNITMMDLKCDYVEVDVVSVLGNNQNATKFVKKVPLDANGVLNAMVRMVGSRRITNRIYFLRRRNHESVGNFSLLR
jgi:hypothetical protein